MTEQLQLTDNFVEDFDKWRVENDHEFQEKYGVSTLEPVALDYLKLCDEAGSAGLDEKYIESAFEAVDAACGFDGAEVFLIGVDWKKFRTVWDQVQDVKGKARRQLKEDEKKAAKKGEKLIPPDPPNPFRYPPALLENELIAKKKWAKEQGLSDTEILTYWGGTGTDEQDMKPTPARLDRFQQLVCQHIYKRGEANEQLSDLSVDGTGSGSAADDSSNGDNEPAKESGVATVHDHGEAESQAGSSGENVQSKDSAEGLRAPTIRYIEFCTSLEGVYSKFEIDSFLQDYKADMGLEEPGVTHDLLDAFELYVKTCAAQGIKAPQASKPASEPSNVNEETGEVEIAPILQVLGFVEFPKLTDPDIEKKIEKIGDVIATDLERIARYKRNCEDRCKPLQDHIELYEKVFGGLIKEHAATKLKRVKTGKNAGNITGSKTIVYDTFAVSFEKTGGMWVSNKAELESFLLKNAEAREALKITVKQVPVYENKALLNMLKERGNEIKALREQQKASPEAKQVLEEKIKELHIELPGIADVPVNEIGKFEIKASKKEKAS